jgi:hypothetical protein
MNRAIDELNDEMVAAGVRVFVGGLHPVADARSLQARPDGGVAVTDRPLPQDPRARRRVLGARGLRPGRGPGMGSEGGARLPCAGRSAPFPLSPAQSRSPQRVWQIWGPAPSPTPRLASQT